jgi:hypothetical protein
MAPGIVVSRIMQRRPGIAGVRDYLALVFVAAGTARYREPMMNRLPEPLRILVA